MGNVRLSYTLDPADNVVKIMEENHYYPFGLKHNGYSPTQKIFAMSTPPHVVLTPVLNSADATYKYKYNGKELQDELGLNLYDYGARNYDSAIGRWINIDPLAEKSRRFSPYAYALDNPVYFIDPDSMEATQSDVDMTDLNANLSINVKPDREGTNPIYDTQGNFLGTDDRGLQGLGLIMNKEDFSQGMSGEEADSKNLGPDCFNNVDAYNKAATHHANLPSRPDFDGKLTLGEANSWFEGNSGESLFVDSSQISVYSVETGDFENGVGSSMYNNFFGSSDYETGVVYGTIKMTLQDSGGTVKLGGTNGLIDVYDFDQRKNHIDELIQ